MDEVKGSVLAAWCLDELLGDTFVSERFVYIKVVHPANLFILFQSNHLPVSYRARVFLIFAR
jgi:hypothetical protein